MQSKRLVFWLMGLLILAAVSGCASVGKVTRIEPPTTGQKAAGAEKGWWYARFRMDWPPDTEAAWYMDVLLAHRVISPVLRQHEKEISLWRFHRRAARDKSGHQFSFIFYSPRETAQQIYQAIRSSDLLKELVSAHVVADTMYDDTTAIFRPDLGATSDRNWSPEIKRTWPFYIMGVSRMWLNLIDEVSKETLKGENLSNLEELLAGYRKVNDVIEEKWRREGSHAFLHHLNAIFGYEPLVVYERRLTNF